VLLKTMVNIDNANVILVHVDDAAEVPDSPMPDADTDDDASEVPAHGEVMAAVLENHEKTNHGAWSPAHGLHIVTGGLADDAVSHSPALPTVSLPRRDEAQVGAHRARAPH
jgi:hypothetical protein